jgi:hypothetical protein
VLLPRDDPALTLALGLDLKEALLVVRDAAVLNQYDTAVSVTSQTSAIALRLPKMDTAWSLVTTTI